MPTYLKVAPAEISNSVGTLIVKNIGNSGFDKILRGRKRAEPPGLVAPVMGAVHDDIDAGLGAVPCEVEAKVRLRGMKNSIPS